MNVSIRDLYGMPSVSEYDDICLQSLRENCLVLEERLRELIERLSDCDRQLIEAYLDIREELELQTVKILLQWGKELQES